MILTSSYTLPFLNPGKYILKVSLVIYISLYLLSKGDTKGNKIDTVFNLKKLIF